MKSTVSAWGVGSGWRNLSRSLCLLEAVALVTSCTFRSVSHSKILPVTIFFILVLSLVRPTGLEEGFHSLVVVADHATKIGRLFIPMSDLALWALSGSLKKHWRWSNHCYKLKHSSLEENTGYFNYIYPSNSTSYLYKIWFLQGSRRYYWNSPNRIEKTVVGREAKDW